MFGPLGAMEILFIMVLALLIFGPRRLPEVGRTVGKALGEFRRATNDLKRSVNAELALEEERPQPRRPASPRAAVGGAESAAAAGAAGAGAAAPNPRPAAGTHPRAPVDGAAGDEGSREHAPGAEHGAEYGGVSEWELLAANPGLAGGSTAGDEAADPHPQPDAEADDAGGSEEPAAARDDAPPAAGTRAAD